jgi:ABC-type glycerol-3-phosphate transport system substrate-binding protein
MKTLNPTFCHFLLLSLVLLFCSTCTENQTAEDFSAKTISGPFSWQRANGQTLKLFLNKHPFAESLLPALPEFTTLTGIEIDYTILSEEDYRDKLIIELSSRTGAVDVFMTGPMTWISNTWYDAKEQFESGRYAMFLDCDFFAASYEDPGQSRIAGKVGYALPPAGPEDKIISNIWTWALSINRYSNNKMAGWLFIQWATAREQLLTATLSGNWNPPRKSVWNNEKTIAILEKWGNYRQV